MLRVENLAMPSKLLMEEEILRLFKYYLKTEQMLMLKTEIRVVLSRLLLEEFLRSSNYYFKLNRFNAIEPYFILS